MLFLAALITQAPTAPDQIHPQKPVSGTTAADLAQLDSPPELGVDSKNLVAAKKEQLRLLKQFLEGEIKNLEKSQKALKSELAQGPSIAAALQTPSMAGLKDCSKDESLINAYSDYMNAIAQIRTESETNRKNHTTLGPPTWMISHAAAQNITLGDGPYILADARHASAWRQFTEKFLEHCKRETTAASSAMQTGPKPLVEFLANRARLTDLTLLLNTVDRHLMWSNQQPM